MGPVTAVVTGEHRVQSITIEPEVIDPEDVEMLQDLVAAAVNEALGKYLGWDVYYHRG